ncbi:MAG: c-type cytochrome [Gammaproteobacteria bacterium]|nr:c-type cytochrome [Gammaproteobacteria bacterium]MCF6261383.1 c-type cytochrome [Gammaproteobacteria bacterium]
MMKGFRVPAFWQAIFVVIIAYLIFDNAFPPLLPASLLVQYMIITIVGVLLYFSFDEARWNEFKSPILAVLREPKLIAVRWGFLIIIPGIIGYTTYGFVKPSMDAPVELRQVHPAPPGSLRVFGKKYNLSTLENPLRTQVLETMAEDKDKGWQVYNDVVESGREVYYKNCFYCHGDLLDGKGPYARGFNPQPANFQNVGTIAQLQEAYLFWRISTGGPALPTEGTPWNSAMPVWHEMLDEKQIWQVITFLFDYVGQVPRIWDADVSKVVTGMKNEIKTRHAKQMGKELYAHRCQACHGEQGAGDGLAAEYMYPKPRDFTLALFKYKTSPGTELPRDDDLFNTIKNGLTGTSMPGWASLLSDKQMRSLIPVIKSFDITAAWAPEDADDDAFDDDGLYLKTDFRKITQHEPLMDQVPFNDESVAKGKPVFEKVCGKCHGFEGRGNITSGKKLEDDWGNRLWPRDLTKPWVWRASNVSGDESAAREQTIKNIYSRLSIGLPGTPMPAHRATEEGNKDPVSAEDRWHIANYVYTLREKTQAPSDEPVVRAMKVEGALPDDINAEIWDEVPAVTLVLVPNIIKEERLFTPLNDAVTVRVLYNDDEISFLLEVNDRTDSRPGEKESMQIHDASLTMHSDAIAIQFPQQASFETRPVVVKPLYRHGNSSHPVTIWYWNAGSLEPEITPRSVLLDAYGPDQKMVPRDADNTFSANGKWEHGRWRILMKRPRQGGDSGDVSFNEGSFIPVSFANWDGNNGEAGSKHTLTTWYWLILPPHPDPVRVYGLPFGVAGGVFLLGIILVRSHRKAG